MKYEMFTITLNVLKLLLILKQFFKLLKCIKYLILNYETLLKHSNF